LVVPAKDKKLDHVDWYKLLNGIEELANWASKAKKSKK